MAYFKLLPLLLMTVAATLTGRVLAKPPAKAAMQNLVAKWRGTGSVMNKNRNYPKRVRTPENIARVQESLEQSPMKSQRRLPVQVGIKRISCRKNICLLKIGCNEELKTGNKAVMCLRYCEETNEKYRCTPNGCECY
ncbi:hypothetical protein ANN_15520 [Periplaneta americana]|uniref:Uncharacterized protein n=1 Tax=Periplaneta americana TaxID=6978 RepID=A0ABQ8SHG5_PERAM|nr:hypothetical protein ANN_15520 [Periplaneta americana]